MIIVKNKDEKQKLHSVINYLKTLGITYYD